MRKIEVIFTDRLSLDIIAMCEGKERYTFVIPYPEIRLGAIIEIYDAYIKNFIKAKYAIVTKILDFSTEEDNYPIFSKSKIKNIDNYSYKDKINLITKEDNIMEKETTKKNISITIEEAREWYKGNNKTLKELSLKAFSEEELKSNNYKEILERREILNKIKFISIPVIENKITHIEAVNKLKTIAYALNEGWIMSSYDTGFCIIKSNKGEYRSTKHEGFRYPEITYFKSSEAANTAIEIAKIEGWIEYLYY